MLSTPPVWRATLRLAKAASSALTSFGRGVWACVKNLLGHGGTTGARVSQSLSQAGAALRGAARAVLAHLATQPVLQTLKSMSGLVRPVSQGMVTHRLLGLLVPAVWLRVALELIALPLLLAPGFPTAIRSRLGGKRPMAGDAPGSEQPHPMAAAAVSETDNCPFAAEWEQPAPTRNRAERRAQQQNRSEPSEPAPTSSTHLRGRALHQGGLCRSPQEAPC